MTFFILVSFFVSLSCSVQMQAEKHVEKVQRSTVNEADQKMITTLFNEALSKGHSYEMLRELCTKVGARLSGSPEAQHAVELTQKMMESYGFDRVYLQEVMVPRWVRGAREKAWLDDHTPLNIRALGGSVATPEKGLHAEVIEVQSLDDVAKLGEKVKGKIVFYNRPFDFTHVETFTAYSGAVDQRFFGPSQAAKYGAVGVLVRSMSTANDDFPHTGTLGYVDSLPKIPAAALSVMAANKLTEELQKNKTLSVTFKQNCETLPDVKSYNVIGELNGSEKPEEIIVVGGHLDSWDLGDGAHDDGAGCVQSIEAVRLFKALNIRPKRTIRAVMFMNEENGLRGGNKYAELAKANGETHIAAIESDAGGFTPRGFGVNGSDEAVQKIASWVPLFNLNTINYGVKGYGGADINPLNETQGTVCIGLRPDSQRYFDLHHTDNDTFDKINKRELELGAASMSALLYLIDKYGM